MSNRETLTLSELTSFLKYINDFAYDIEITSNNIEQIIKAQNEGVNLHPIDPFIGHYVFLSYSHCVITINKLFYREERLSYIKLFNKIRNCKFDSEFSKLLQGNDENQYSEYLAKNRDELIELVNELEKEIDLKSELIEKFRSRRDTFYAHTDPKKISEVETLIEIREICELAKNVYNKVNGKLYDSTFLFSFNIASIGSVLNDRKFVDDYWSKLEEENRAKTLKETKIEY